MISPLDKTKYSLVAPLFEAPTKIVLDMFLRGHVYFPLTRGNSRLLRQETLGNGHLRAVTLGNARCLVGPPIGLLAAN